MPQVFEDIIVDDEFAALIPPLSAEERQQLEENIAEHGGARDPLVVWVHEEWRPDGCENSMDYDDARIEILDGQDHRIWEGDDDILYGDLDWPRTLLDGHNRYEICTRLGLSFDIEEMRFSDRSHAEEWIIRNQFGRRNLSTYDRGLLALQLEKTIANRMDQQRKETQGRPKRGKEKLPQKSSAVSETREAVAGIAGVSHDTITKIKKIAAAVEEGRVDAETIDQLRHRGTSINRVVRDLKEQETSAKRQEQKAAAVAKLQDVDGLYLGDFRKIGDKIPDASVDLIFTDPPYDRKAIELYDGLGEFASRVLRPGGSLIAYVGHIQLPDALADLSKHLRYWWTCGCFHAEAKARMTEYGIVAGWKPIVWFVKETRGDKQTFITDVVTGAREKSHHDWQQAVSEARYFIDHLTQHDGFVVDPFCGGGTTPVACIQSGRKWASFEIDEANFANASSRIKEVMDDQAIQ
jgi:16S rRNA G966 N2-methylase RsmD